MNQKTKDWLIAITYVAIIYATLEVARIPLAFLRSHGWLRFSLGILFFISALFIVAIIARHHGASVWRYIVLIGVGLTYVFASKFQSTPEEQVHFFEYGLVGVFFLRAVRHHFDETHWKYFIAFLLATAAGWIDELLQGITPTRHYDIRDVLFNAISAALGLVLYATCKKGKTHR